MNAMTSARKGILVFGGAGQLGARIVKLLLDSGEDVTVFVRPTSDRSRLDGLAVTFAVGDLLNDDDVAAAFESTSFRAVIVAVRAPRSESGFYEAACHHIARYATQANVGQIIHHGAVGAGANIELHPDVPWDSVPGMRARMQDHGKAEASFRNCGVSTTIIRNSQVWPDDTPCSGHAELTEDQHTLTPITRVDLARFTMECLDETAGSNKVFHARDMSLSRPSPPPRT